MLLQNRLASQIDLSGVRDLAQADVSWQCSSFHLALFDPTILAFHTRCRLRDQSLQKIGVLERVKVTFRGPGGREQRRGSGCNGRGLHPEAALPPDVVQHCLPSLPSTAGSLKVLEIDTLDRFRLFSAAMHNLKAASKGVKRQGSGLSRGLVVMLPAHGISGHLAPNFLPSRGGSRQIRLKFPHFCTVVHQLRGKGG